LAVGRRQFDTYTDCVNNKDSDETISIKEASPNFTACVHEHATDLIGMQLHLFSARECISLLRNPKRIYRLLHIVSVKKIVGQEQSIASDHN
jgi:hypothetical protein